MVNGGGYRITYSVAGYCIYIYIYIYIYISLSRSQTDLGDNQ